MKSNYFFIYTIAFFLIWSCTSDESTNGTAGTDDGGGPITHNLDTTDGYCFQLFEDGVGEGLEITIKGNKVKVAGKRIYLANQVTYRLTGEGILNGNTVEVDLYAADTRDVQKPYTHREIWEFSEDFLTIKNRKIEGMEGSYQFYRVTCQTQPNKDTNRYDSFSGFNEGGYAVVSKKGKYGVVNKNNELTVPLFYRDLGTISNGMVSFYDQYMGLYGLLDVTNGKMLAEPKYVEIMGFSDGLAAFLTEEGKWGFLNESLEVVIEPQFTNVNFFKPDPNRRAFNEGLANVEIKQGKWSYIDKTGNVVIAGDFLHTKAFENGEAEVYKDNKWYFINKAGECIRNCD